MKDIRIVTDSSCDLIKGLPNVIVLPYKINRNNEEELYSDEGKINRKIALDYFYNDIHWNNYPPTVKDLLSLTNDKEVDYIYIPAIGGPDIKLEYLSTMYTGLTSGGLGLLINDLQELIYDGASKEDLITYIERSLNKYKTLLMPNPDYQNGIKVVNERKSILYDFLDLKPILSFNEEGKIVVSKSYHNLNDLVDKLLTIMDSDRVRSMVLLHSFKSDEDVFNIYMRLKEKYRSASIDKMSLTNTAKYGHKTLELAYKEI